jgi:ketopantoate reductase
MKQPVVIIGVGEIGGVLARGLLRTGHPVYPVTRTMDMATEADQVPEPLAVIVAVAEKDLHPTLQAIPDVWRDRVVLLQNELLPRDWEAHHYERPTVVSIWFEKKAGQDAKVLLPSPVVGPNAKLVVDALAAVNIPARELQDADELLYELVRKNVYILTTNIAGLECKGTVRELWHQHEHVAREVAQEVMDIQDWLTGTTNDRERLIAGMLEGFDGDPEHRCTGRSAPARLERALHHADAAGLAVRKLRAIHTQA